MTEAEIAAAAALATAAAATAAAEKAAADKATADKATADKATADAAAAAALAARGNNTPTDAEAKLLKEVMKNKDALKTASDALAQANERLAKFDGVDPEAIKKLVNEQKSAEDAALAAKGDWDRLKTNMATEHTKVTSGMQAQIDALNATLKSKSTVIDAMSIGQQFTSSRFIGDELTLTPAKARLVYGGHFDVQEDGTVVGYDKPRGSAARTPVVDALGNPQGFDEVLRKLVDTDPDKDFLLKSKVKAGAASNPVIRPGAAAKPGTPSAEQQKSGLDKIAAGLKGLAKPLV